MTNQTEYFVVYWEDEIRMESGRFSTFDAAERWMNNNLNSSIKHAFIDSVEIKSWHFVNVR